MWPESPAPDPADAEDSGVPGHAERIEKIFRDHNDSLLRFLAARLGSSQDAKDVAQEAYVRLLQLHEPAAVGFLRAFLFKTAANLAIDRIRSRQSTRRRENLFLDLAADTERSAEQTASIVEDASIATSALGELPERCRVAFLLSRLDGLTTLEIAARLGVSDRAVRKYLVRALDHVHDRLQRAAKSGRGDL